jgi:hypothetical protein
MARWDWLLTTFARKRLLRFLSLFLSVVRMNECAFRELIGFLGELGKEQHLRTKSESTTSIDGFQFIR